MESQKTIITFPANADVLNFFGVGSSVRFHTIVCFSLSALTDEPTFHFQLLVCGKVFLLNFCIATIAAVMAAIQLDALRICNFIITTLILSLYVTVHHEIITLHNMLLKFHHSSASCAEIKK